MPPFAAAASFFLLLAARTRAAPAAAITAAPTMVYDFYSQHCPPLPAPGCSLDIAEGCDCDIADAPMRFFRRSGGDGQVVSLASVDLGSRGFAGASALALAHDCALYANSTRAQAFESFANYEWIHSSWYFSANNSVYALTHMEWDCKSAQSCAFYGLGYSFFSAVTLMRSLDGGASWDHALPPPAHIVAVSPVAWTPALGAAGKAFGFRSPSSIVAGRGAQAGFYFATVTANWGGGSFEGQLDGACMMRTRDVTAPGSWRAWGGSAFDVNLAQSPWGGGGGAKTPCVPFTNSTYASLAWSTVFGQYMYFGTAGGDDHAGWELRLSSDLAAWSAPTRVAAPPQFIAPAGNASVVPSGASFSGRFVQRADHAGDARVWWENAEHTVRRAVGSCTPCPGLPACGAALVQIPDAEFDALAERAAFSCAWMYNTSGYGDFFYPTLIDPASTSDNFDEVGADAQPFLVGQRCVNAAGDGSCSPFDEDGLLVRNLLRVPVVFSNNATEGGDA